MSAPSDPLPLPDFLEARRSAMRLDLSFGQHGGTHAEWRDALERCWRAGLPPCEGLPDGEVTGDAVRLRFATGAVAEGCLVRPAGAGPHPAVLLLHDHGGAFEIGWRKLFDLDEARAGQARHYGGRAPAATYLNAGFAVLCLDAPGWGGRRAGDYDGQQALAANALGLGWSLAGLTAGEDVQAAAWLAAQPGIDAARIGAFGFSFGGFRAWQVAALSPHVRATASLSWMAGRAALMRPGAPLLKGQSAFHFLHPGVTARADFPDLAGLAAGKALFFRSGRGDRHMPEDAVTAAWTRIAEICAAAGAPAPDTALHDHAHTCPPETLDEAVAFLRRSLT